MITGEKVYLRPIVKEDINALNKWKNDEETFKNLGGGFLPTSIDQQEKWMDAIIDTSGNAKRFIICNKNEESIGMAGIYDINWIHSNCEIGVYLGEKNVKGEGYGKEACILIEKFVAEYLNLRKIKLSVVSSNSAAVGMWESLGYNKVGEFKEERFIKGKYENLSLMEKFVR